MTFGINASRWTLPCVLDQCQAWLPVTTPSGMWRILQRLNVTYKRGRHYVHSPDPHYAQKLDAIAACLAAARAEPERFVFLYLDELTFYRQPSVANDYAPRGHAQPLARRSHRANTAARVLAAMNALTGQVTYVQRSKTTLSVFRDFYQLLRTTYPDCECIYVAQDNWPQHFHPDIRVLLAPQTFAWPPQLPKHWSTTSQLAPPAQPLPIQLLFQPTYAPWTNPIEKLWRRLYQQHLHLHRLSDQWDALKQCVTDFLDGFSQGSSDLLHYTGLLPG
jgi:hypothetical protein